MIDEGAGWAARNTPEARIPTCGSGIALPNGRDVGKEGRTRPKKETLGDRTGPPRRQQNWETLIRRFWEFSSGSYKQSRRAELPKRIGDPCGGGDGEREAPVAAVLVGQDPLEAQALQGSEDRGGVAVRKGPAELETPGGSPSFA